MINLNLRAFKQKINDFPKPAQLNIIEEKRFLKTDVPIHIPGDLQNVKGVPFGISIQDELDEFYRTEYTSGPFYRFQLNDLLLLKNRIYFDKYEYLLNPWQKPIRIYDNKLLKEYDEIAFSSMRISTVFFGHWLHEELMLIDYLQNKKQIFSSSPLTPQKIEIADLFNLNYEMSSYAFIRKADMYEGWQHTKIYNDALNNYKRIISKLQLPEKKQKVKIVYLKRGASSVARELMNESELLDFLSEDYEVVSCVAETTPIQELYAEIYTADIIFSVEGSQLAHGLIAGKPKSILACIQPPYRFYNPFKNYCADAGMKYAVFVAEQSSDKNSFFVDLNRVQLFMERLEREL